MKNPYYDTISILSKHKNYHFVISAQLFFIFLLIIKAKDRITYMRFHCMWLFIWIAEAYLMSSYLPKNLNYTCWAQWTPMLVLGPNMREESDSESKWVIFFETRNLTIVYIEFHTDDRSIQRKTYYPITHIAASTLGDLHQGRT